MKITRNAGQASILLDERLDAHNAPHLKSIFLELSQVGIHQLEVHASQVEFLDSAGLAAIISGLKLARSGRGELYIVNASPVVKQLLSLTLLDQVIPQREG
ncbi:STAS domain-containing protein [Deinococcus misasensis]|uniref:STAS domain-containing protein n=1 Tax=Deinococcus misasensis TaxID=392413 RepID=UPI000557EDEF|nr:STAS domain-containing protein [Deinococcus misasensis]